MIIFSDEAVNKARKLVEKFNTRDPYRLAKFLDINILEQPFKKQKGVYKVIEKNRFIFVKEDLNPIMKSIVILHEIGHDQLHRNEAIKVGGFKEFNIFEMTDIRMEYEANIFAANVSLSDDDVSELLDINYDVAQIASELNSDINLVALKVSNYKVRLYNSNRIEFNARFLK